MQQVSENSIMELIRQRGILRFSTLMVSFHLSSVEAISIVEECRKTKRHSKKARAKTGREPKEEKNEKTHPA